MVELDPLRIGLEHLREVALEDDRGTAEPDRLVTLVEQRLGDDPDRIREVDDPCVRRELAHAVRDLQDDRHRSECLRQAPEAGRLLPEATARERH